MLYRTLLIATVAVLAPALSVGSAAAQDIEGTWEYVAERSDDVNAAVERAVSGMSFITRPIARRRLRGATQPARTLVIEGAATDITMIIDTEQPVRMPADGSPVRWRRSDGEVFEVRGVVRDGSMVQTFRAEEGIRENTYRIRADGLLEMRVQVSSERLPAPVEFSLYYRRTPS